MPSSRRRKSGTSEMKRSKEVPEIVHQLGRVALAYSLKKLSEQKALSNQQRSRSSRRGSSHRQPSEKRDHSSTSKRGTGRDLPRSDSSEMHALASQLAVGVLAFGIRHLVRRRREAKSKAAEAASKTTGQTAGRAVNGNSSSGQDSGGSANMDSEMSAALDAVAKELQGATESIQQLAYAAPPSHRDCAVRDALVADAERLSGSLANMQASINNMRNLHPGLEARAERRLYEKVGARDGDRQETEGVRPRNRRRNGMTEGIGGKGRVEEWAERVRHRRGRRTEDSAGGETDRRQRERASGADDGGPHGRSVGRLRRRLSRRDDELQRAAGLRQWSGDGFDCSLE